MAQPTLFITAKMNFDGGMYCRLVLAKALKEAVEEFKKGEATLNDVTALKVLYDAITEELT